MNTKFFLSACLLSLSVLSCHTQATLPEEESCPVEELPVFKPSASIVTVDTVKPASAPVYVTITPEPVAPKITPTRDEAEIRLVISPNKKPMIALQTVVDTSLVKGKAKWVSKKDPYAVRHEVDLAALPESTVAWVGQAVKLYRKDGTFCEANVTGLSLLGQLYLFDDQKKLASDIFKRSLENRGVRIVAELDIEACEGAAFARLASLPAPNIVVPEKASKDLSKLVLPKVRALSQYKEIQALYATYFTETNQVMEHKRWENYYGEGPKVTTLQSKDRTLVVASIQKDGGCGDFYGALFSIWELKSDGSLAFLYQGGDFITPDFALDVDGDNTLEFFQGESWQQLQNGKFQVVDKMEIAYEEETCGC